MECVPHFGQRKRLLFNELLVVLTINPSLVAKNETNDYQNAVDFLREATMSFVSMNGNILRSAQAGEVVVSAHFG